MQPTQVLTRSQDMRIHECWRVFVERTYAFLFCIFIVALCAKLLISKPLGSKAKIIASQPTCSLAGFWVDAYEKKDCTLQTSIAITELASNTKHATSVNYKNFWVENPYNEKQKKLKFPHKAFVKQKIKWKYRREIGLAHKVTGVSKNLIAAVIIQESNGDPRAKSHCGALGLMQLMPATAKRFGCTNAFDPQQNILAGSKYLAWLTKHFKGNRTKIIAAYNSGEGNVERYGGIPPFKETQLYVPRVLENEHLLAMLGD